VTSQRPRTAPLLGLLAAALALGRPAPAEAFSPYLVVPDPAVAEASPAYRYANMTDGEAFAELDRRRILYTKLEGAAGVRAPIRLTGRLHGVYIHSSLPPDQRVVSLFEILDARLALSLDDFAAVLSLHDIDEVIHFTMYRPNAAAPDHGLEDEPAAAASSRMRASHGALASKAAPPAKPPAGEKAPAIGKGALDPKATRAAPAGVKQKPDAPSAKQELMVIAKKPAAGAPAAIPAARKGAPAIVAHRDPAPVSPRVTWAPPGTRHPAGLAIDVGLLHKRDGRWLSVAKQFHGHIGDKTCGDGAHVPEDPDARELRSLVCESADLGVFTYVLTPDYNAAHVDHFHMEIKPGVRWFLYH
jgi:Extensin-like protein C-terminus